MYVHVPYVMMSSLYLPSATSWTQLAQTDKILEGGDGKRNIQPGYV